MRWIIQQCTPYDVILNFAQWHIEIDIFEPKAIAEMQWMSKPHHVWLEIYVYGVISNLQEIQDAKKTVIDLVHVARHIKIQNEAVLRVHDVTDSWMTSFIRSLTCTYLYSSFFGFSARTTCTDETRNSAYTNVRHSTRVVKYQATISIVQLVNIIRRLCESRYTNAWRICSVQYLSMVMWSIRKICR